MAGIHNHIVGRMAHTLVLEHMARIVVLGHMAMAQHIGGIVAGHMAVVLEHMVVGSMAARTLGRRGFSRNHHDVDSHHSTGMEHIVPVGRLAGRMGKHRRLVGQILLVGPV